MSKQQIVLVPHRVQVELFGAQTVTVRVGSTVRLLPHCDLWMQGAKTAEVRRIRGSEADGFKLDVRPIVDFQPVRGKLRTIETEHVDLTPAR